MEISDYLTDEGLALFEKMQAAVRVDRHGNVTIADGTFTLAELEFFIYVHSLFSPLYMINLDGKENIRDA